MVWGLVALTLVAGAVGWMAYSSIRAGRDVQPEITESDWQQRQLQLEERLNVMDPNEPIDTLLEEIRSFAADAPMQVAAQRLLGQAELLGGSGEAGYEALAASLKLDSTQVELQRLAGTAAFELRRFDEAEMHYNTSLELVPDHVETRLYLAETLVERGEEGDRDKALLLINESIRLDDSLHMAYFRLSGLRLKENNADSALESVRDALDRVDRYEDERIYFMYRAHEAKILIRLREFESALAILARHPERETKSMLEQVAGCHAQLGQPEEAARKYYLAAQSQGLIPDAELVERTAHWWIQADELERAQTALDTYRSHPDAIPEMVASLERRLEARRQTAAVPTE